MAPGGLTVIQDLQNFTRWPGNELDFCFCCQKEDIVFVHWNGIQVFKKILQQPDSK